MLFTRQNTTEQFVRQDQDLLPFFSATSAAEEL